MRYLALLFVLCACDTPGPHFKGIPAQRVVIAGPSFDARVRDGLAEATGRNAEYAPRYGPIAARAQAAMEHVSGCSVTKLQGDQAYSIGKLNCGKVPNDRVSGIGDAECLVTDRFVRPSTQETVLELDCEPIR